MRIDLEKNRLYFTISGHFALEELINISDEIIASGRQQWQFSSLLAGYQALECSCLAEAENLLDDLERKEQ